MDLTKKIFVAGHRGMVGSAIVRRLHDAGYTNVVTQNRAILDLTDQSSVNKFFENHAFDQVYLAAARVGGIHANNSYPAQFIYENLVVQSNVIHAAHMNGVQDLLFLGSSCIYPRLAAQPMTEELLLTGLLEPTNEPYAIAKIAGIKLCESYNRQYGRNYRSVMPTNLYGTNDNFHPENSHVIPALIRKFYEAKRDGQPIVTIWGSGNPRREFLHVDDMAAACVHVLNLDSTDYYDQVTTMVSHVNVGSGIDYSIKELVDILADISEFQGEIVYDSSKPDGAPRKLMDVSRLARLGWNSSIPLVAGLRDTYSWYTQEHERARFS
ncbi:GDP-L-fucose synthase [Stutzerimonas stutzeri]|jgi:GDP-L-fucose synthase|uniref:GDP-L-fucose synthase n=1 Tax=Stutzerimonas stutzeri TaxID=316 RepID=A0A5S5BG85_STUST|nr:GDP-L-fucose synthase [Stutzerimonas stutzeri]RRU90367.1 GDP-L-fucose synthase [Stutzerimonas xanthomarina]TYP65322.1 GDP-L-fucose synthase [Stutzerimonas stutzeri]|tara:strand:- start:41 stop:1012 length:972 start_codon:yes stop_codon:yes gene_type:complete